MEEKELKNIKINKICELEDAALEHEFFSRDTDNSIKFIKTVLLFLGLLNFSFLIPDYFLTPNKNAYLMIFIGRAVFLILVLVLIQTIDKIKYSRLFSIIISVYEVLCCMLFLVVFYNCSRPDFLIQSFGIMVITLAMLVIPNKWILNLGVSISITSIFLIFSVMFFNIEFYNFIAGFVYLSIVVVLCSIYSYRINYYKRIDFLNNKELEKLAATDPMTGLYNKKKFEEQLKLWFDYSKRYDIPLCLAIFDIDDFKKLNDMHGHVFGDKIIIEASEIMKKIIRSTDILTRWGGDEFVLLMPNTDLSQAKALIERLRNSIENSFSEKIRTTFSFGIVSIEKNEDEVHFLSRADKLLYVAKNCGKNKVIC